MAREGFTASHQIESLSCRFQIVSRIGNFFIALLMAKMPAESGGPSG